MVKIKTISRPYEEVTRETPTQLMKVHKNPDPLLHPFERAREYTRALNTTKVEKILAKPFLGALSGHSDGVFSLAKNPKSLSCFLSGSCDGEIRIWHLPSRKTVWYVKGHSSIVRGLVVHPSGRSFFSCSNDKYIKLWSLDYEEGTIGKEEEDMREIEKEKEPLNTWLGKDSFTGIDHKHSQPVFATSGTVVEIWDETRSSPIRSFEWGSDSITSVKFNPVETDILASTATDRAVALYDIRGNTPIRKVIMEMKSNAVSWNPMEAFHFTIANEDHNLYTFDMRNLQTALYVHKDHVSAVLDVDYSPTGREFVSGSYDCSLRIFSSTEGRSREVYHTRRMQKIFSVKFSQDSKYVLSGSDDTNIRLWKAVASEKLGVMLPREKTSIEYAQKVKDRYKHLPEVRRIEKHRKLPKTIYKSKKLKEIMEKSQKTREENRIKNNFRRQLDKVKRKPEKKKHIVTERQ